LATPGGGEIKVAAAFVAYGLLTFRLDLTAGSLASTRRIALWFIGR
jgi:hypothetical protein